MKIYELQSQVYFADRQVHLFVFILAHASLISVRFLLIFRHVFLYSRLQTGISVLERGGIFEHRTGCSSGLSLAMLVLEAKSPHPTAGE